MKWGGKNIPNTKTMNRSIMLFRCSFEREVSKHVEEDRYKKIRGLVKINLPSIRLTGFFYIHVDQYHFHVSHFFLFRTLKSNKHLDVVIHHKNNPFWIYSVSLNFKPQRSCHFSCFFLKHFQDFCLCQED